MFVKSFLKRPVIVISFIVFVLVFAFVGKFSFVTEAETNPQATMLVPTITATNVDALVTDVDGDGRADPGDTIEYTVIVNNTAPAGAGNDALNMIFNETLDANTTLVGGSVNTSPIAGNDAYPVYGNVSISIADGATDLLANDIDPDTGNNTGMTATAGTISSASCAGCNNVVIAANGSFTYDPPVGFTGADTFTYTTNDTNGGTSTGTVTLNISGMIWFINNTAAACTTLTLASQCGKLSKPFSTIEAFRLVNDNDTGNRHPANNHNIFIYQSATNYTPSFGILWLSGQRLIGQDASPNATAINNSAILNLTMPTGSATLPSTNTAGDAVTISGAGFTVTGGNTIRGLTITTVVTTKLSGSGFGTLTLGDIALSGGGKALDLITGTLAIPAGVSNSFTSIASTGSSTQGINLSAVGGTLTVTGTTSVSGAGTQGINISGSSVAANFGTSTSVGSVTQGILIGTSTGNVSFGNTTVTAGTDGVSLQNNSAGTRSFGTLSTTNGSGVGFLHGVGGGAVTVTGAATFTNPAGRCIDIQSTTATMPIAFANANATQCGGIGVFLNANAGAVTFADLDISPDANVRAFQATNNTGVITTTSGTIPSTGTATAVEITNASGTVPLNMQLTSVSASGAANGIILTNTSASGGPGGFRVLGNGGNCNTADPTCTGGTIQNTSGSGIVATNAESLQLTRMRIVNPGNHGIDAPNLKGTCLFSNSMVVDWTFATGNGIQVVNNNTNLTLLTVTGSTFNGTATSNTGVRIEAQGASNMTLSVEGGSVFTDMFGDGVQSVTTSTWTNTSTVTVSVLNSFFNNAAANGNGGIHTDAVGHGTFNYTYSGNNFNNIMRPVTNLGAINANMGCPSGCATNADGPTVNGTITNNTLDQIIGSRGMSIIADTLAKRLNVTIDNNFIDRLPNAKYAIFASSRNTVPDANVTIINNDIGTLFPLATGNSEVVFVQAQDSSTMKTLINNNIVTASTAFEVIKVVGSTGTANVQATITNNNATDTDATARQEIEPRAAAATTVCADIRSNFPGGAAGRVINLDEISGATLSVNPGPNTASVAGANNAATVTTTGSGAPPIFFTGSCTLPSFAPLAEESAFNTNNSSDNNLGFSNVSYQTPSEMLATIKPFVKPSLDTETVPNSSIVMAKASAEANGTNYLATVSAFFSEAASKLGAAIFPTVTAQDTKEQTPNISGETITIGAPTGFTLPASKSITIKFRATVNNTPIGLTQVSTQGTVSGSNFGSVLTDDTAVGGGADPTATLIDSTTVTVSSSQNPSLTGQSVTFTATLTGAPVHATGDPAGTVQFFDNAVPLGAPQAVAAGAANDNTGTATFTVSNLSAGSHPITATFSGGGTGPGGFNANNTSNTVNQVVSNTAVWDGSTSTAWADGTNWTTNGVPSLATNDVSIPAAGVANNPTISAADVTVNNLTLSAGRTLTINTNRTLNINGLLTMSGNNIDATSGVLSLSTTGTVTRTSGSVLGNMDKIFGATGAFTYPVGTSTGFSPVEVNITNLATNPSTLRVRANDGTAIGIPPLNDLTTLDRFWTLTETGNLTANVTFNYLQTDVDGNENNYRVIRITGGAVLSIANGTPCPGAGSPCVDPGANTIFVGGLSAFSDWTAGELAPNAANVTVAGRVMIDAGRGAHNAEVQMVDGNGNVRTARTNPFGYFRFDEVEVGQSYVFTIRHKLYQFEPRLITINEDVGEIIFTALPE